MKKNRIALISNLLLLLTAIIWGFAFVAQSVGMNYVGPWTFVFSRFIIAAILLLPLTAFSEKNYRASLPAAVEEKHYKTEALRGGAVCGLCLGAASITQQIGMQTTSAGKAGFITACYVVIVPVLGIFIGKRPKKTIWLSVALALIGLYLISMHGGMTIEQGDAMVSLCALLFSFQIISVDHFSEKVNPIRLSNIQFDAVDSVCGCAVVGGRLYAAGAGAEEYGSDDRVAADVAGVGVLGGWRLPDPASDAVDAGAHRMCDRVCGGDHRADRLIVLKFDTYICMG